MSPTVTTLLHYPLICAADHLPGAELRAQTFPRLGYDWAIRFALVPLHTRQPKRLAAQARTEAQSESSRAHRRTTRRGTVTGWDR